MQRNIGTADRVVRVALGIALLGIGFGLVGGVVGAAIGAVAVVPLATAALGWCPLYAALGVRTYSRSAPGGVPRAGRRRHAA